MCEFCCRAFIDATEEDAPYVWMECEGIYSISGDKIYIRTVIDDSGYLVTSADGNESRDLVKKKINFCPMCGVKIPNPTPTDIARRGKQ